MFFGAALIANALYNVVTDFESFATRRSLTDFSLPPILSLLFLPFLYVMAAFVSYEMAFTRLRFFVKDRALLSYAKRKAILRFRFNASLLKRWAERLQMTNPQTRADIDNAFTQVFAMQDAEKNPPAVHSSMGWSPYAAKDFLVGEGLRTGYYHPVFDDKWCASSPYKELPGDSLPNNIAYYVDGKQSAATALRLVLNVNEPQSEPHALDQFVAMAKVLHKAALDMEMSADFEQAITSGKDINTIVGDKRVSVCKEAWRNGECGGYTLELSICRPGERQEPPSS